MKALALTQHGIEDIASLEIKEIIGSAGKKSSFVVEFSIKAYEDLFRLCYISQSCSKFILLFKKQEFKTLNDIKKIMQDIDTKEFIQPDTKIAVRCIRQGIHKFNSVDIEAAASESFLKTTKAKVNLTRPEVTLNLIVIDNTCYVGIDFSGIDLGKRDYKIFSNVRSLNPEIAYALVRYSNFTPDAVFCDPFSGSGEISIEAALFASKLSPNHYSRDKFAFLNIPKFQDIDFDEFFDNLDKSINLKKTLIHSYDNMLKNVTAAKKNAKIAGINKSLSMSRLDIDWLETKFKQNTVDSIAARIPDIPKYNDAGAIKKVVNEFFYQAEFILKKTGTIALFSRTNQHLKDPMKKYKFNLKEQKRVWQGKEKFIVTIITK